MAPRRKKITGVLDGPRLTHSTLKELHKHLKIVEEEFNAELARRIFGRLAEEPEIKAFMKSHYWVVTVP